MRTPERGQLEATEFDAKSSLREIQQATQTHTHLSSTRSVIPNGTKLRKRRIKKVIGACGADTLVRLLLPLLGVV